MNAERFARELCARFGDDRVRRHAPLAPLTTFKVGGPADWLVDLQASAELRDLLALAAVSDVPVRVLGGGSNVLVSDAGVSGVVVRLRGGDVSSLSASRVRADAGVTINGLVRWTLSHGLAGLEAWAGTPGTVGGAIHGNAHFRGRLISELVDGVELVTPAGQVAPRARRGAGIRLRHEPAPADAARSSCRPTSSSRRATPAALRAVARESLAFRKRTQPLASPSAGCIFQNPDPSRDRVPDGIPPSAGALVDRAGLKGALDGGARVSPTHGNFIVNEGDASAADVRRLIERCKTGVRDSVRRRAARGNRLSGVREAADAGTRPDRGGAGHVDAQD